MKNSLKTLRIALACAAVFSVFSGNAQAESYVMTFTGAVTATTCTIGLYTAAAGTTPSASFTVPSVNLTDNPGLGNGGVGAFFGATTFYIKVPTNCVTGGTNGKYNVGFSATSLTGTRAQNTGSAQNVLFDLVSLASSNTNAASMTLAVSPPANSAAATNQTLWGETATNATQSFSVRYYKTSGVNVPVTAGSVVATITATGYYPWYKPSSF